MPESERLPLFGDGDPRRIVTAPHDLEQVVFAALFEIAARENSTLQLKCSTTVVLPGLITMMISSMPDATASSTTTSIAGVSTTGKISLGITFDEGSIRVPIPAARITAFAFIAVRLFPGLELVNQTFDSRASCADSACDAKRGDGARSPFDADIAAAFLAITVGAYQFAPRPR